MSQNGMPQNEAKPITPRARSGFPMSYDVANTLRYGDAVPFFVMESVRGDKVPLFSSYKLRTNPMQSPMMGSLKLIQDYFAVPNRAILPRTWDLYFQQPTQGDDVPDNVAPRLNRQGINNIWENSVALAKSLQDAKSSMSTAQAEWFIKNVLLIESLYSAGSLFNILGYKISGDFHYYPNWEVVDGAISVSETTISGFDRWYELHFIPWFKKLGIVFSDSDGHTYGVRTDSEETAIAADTYIGVHRALEMLRENPLLKFEKVLAVELDSTTNSIVGDYCVLKYGAVPAVYIDISRIIAYQLCYFHHFVNSHIDFIYNADLYRSLMDEILNEGIESPRNDVKTPLVSSANKYKRFSYNGQHILYDTFSFVNFENIIVQTNETSGGNVWALPYLYDTDDAGAFTDAMNGAVGSYWYSLWSYYANLFQIRKSLRFGDYFTGARPTPYAVGDMTADSSTGEVSAVDITRSIMFQRFLNAVNKAGRKVNQYLQEVIHRGDNIIKSDDPLFLGSNESTVAAFEVENTAENQGAVTSMIKSGNGNMAYEFECKESCILLGIASFEMKRYYSRTIERFAFKNTRHDHFQPWLQNIGDQEIYRAERGPMGVGQSSGNFAYTLRHMEYKQRYSQACGAFTDFLKGYLFITDNKDAGNGDAELANIGPDYIRSSNVEFNRFFEQTPYYSLGAYYHFMVVFTNQCEPVRPMEYSPTIL